MSKASPTSTPVDMFSVDRVIKTEWIPVGQLLAHPDNFRVHGKIQQELVGRVISDVGWVRHVLVNSTTQRVVDGHLRVTLAFRKGEDTKVPVDYVELEDAEEALLLSLLDETVGFAFVDTVRRDEILSRLRDAKAYSTTLNDLSDALERRKANANLLESMAGSRAESSERKTLLSMFDNSSDVFFELVMTPEEKKELHAVLRTAMKIYGTENQKDALIRIVQEWKKSNHDIKEKDNTETKRVRRGSQKN